MVDVAWAVVIASVLTLTLAQTNDINKFEYNYSLMRNTLQEGEDNLAGYKQVYTEVCINKYTLLNNRCGPRILKRGVGV